MLLPSPLSPSPCRCITDLHALIIRFVSEARCLPDWCPRWFKHAAHQVAAADKVVAYHPNLSAGWEMRALVFGNTGNQMLDLADTTLQVKQLFGKAQRETVRSYREAARLSEDGSKRRALLEQQADICAAGYMAGMLPLVAPPGQRDTSRTPVVSISDRTGVPSGSWLADDGMRNAYTRNEDKWTVV